VNLTLSTSTEMASEYLRPLQEEKIGKNLVYRVFNDANDGGARKTGVFLSHQQKGDTASSVGELIKHPVDKAAIWDKRVLPIAGMGDVLVEVLVVDKTFSGGKEGTTVLLAISPEDPSLPGKIIQAGIGLKLEELNELLLVPVFSKRHGFFLIASNGKEDPSQSVNLYPFTFNPDPVRKNYAIDGKYGSTLASSAMKKGEILESLYYGTDDEIFWSESPDLDPEDLRFRLKNLESSQVFEPAKVGDKTKYLNLRERAEGGDKGKKGSKGRYEAGLWQVFKKAPQEHPIFKEIAKEGQGSSKTRLFPRLMEILKELADPQKPPQRRVVVVPDELKPHLVKMVLGQWLQARDSSERWSRRNPSMELFLFNDFPVESQAGFIEVLNTISMEVSSKQRAVLFADAAEIAKVKKMEDKGGTERLFTIDDDAPTNDDAVDVLAGTEKSASASQTAPHALYLMATEGKRVPVQEFASNHYRVRKRMGQFD
jgi:hypothetical protein